MFQITVTTENNLIFQDRNFEYVNIKIPEEYQEMLTDLLNYCRTYKSAKEIAYDHLLIKSADTMSDEELVLIAPEYREGEVLPPNAVRVRDGEVIRADGKGKVPERPKEEPIIKEPKEASHEPRHTDSD